MNVVFIYRPTLLYKMLVVPIIIANNHETVLALFMIPLGMKEVVNYYFYCNVCW